MNTPRTNASQYLCECFYCHKPGDKTTSAAGEPFHDCTGWTERDFRNHAAAETVD